MDVTVTQEIIRVLSNRIARIAWRRNAALTRVIAIPRAARPAVSSLRLLATTLVFLLFFAVPAASDVFGAAQRERRKKEQ
jgi:hypothetical protein